MKTLKLLCIVAFIAATVLMTSCAPPVAPSAPTSAPAATTAPTATAVPPTPNTAATKTAEDLAKLQASSTADAATATANAAKPVPPTPAVSGNGANSGNQPNVGSNTATGVCAQKTTREERLDCATAEYFKNGEKLDGFKAYMASLGATWDAVVVGDPFQPSADVLPSGAPRIWGGVLKATNLRVAGNSCLVTDVSTRIANYAWALVDDRYNPRPSVWHAGGPAVSAGNMTEIAFHGDCSDWKEVVAAMEAKSVLHVGPNGITNAANSNAPAATPAPKPASVKPKDIGNLTINAANPWPAVNPFPDAKSAEVAACQYEVGKYDPTGKTRWFNFAQPTEAWLVMKQTCLTGVAWFKDQPAPAGQ